jgi:glycosyltransferase involved in cell wall biosynthesis
VKVAYLSTLEDGGPVSHLLDLAPHVAAAGADVTVVCQTPRVARAFAGRGIQATVIPVRSKWDAVGLAAVARAVRSADVLHTHDRRALLAGAWISSRTNVRFVHTCHGVPENLADRLGRPERAIVGARTWPSRLRLRVEALLGRSAAWIVPSRALAEFLMAHGIPRERLNIVPSRIDRRRCDPGPRHSPFAVGTAARLASHKGIDVLIAACAAAEIELRLDVFGDGPLRAPLQAQARQLGVDAVFHGHVEDVRARLADLDLFVLPSRGDNLPVSILEAMAAALPVVATRVGGIPELVLDGHTGTIVEPDDPVALAAAVRRLAGDERLRRGMGRRGAARIDEAFSAAEAGPVMANLYERVCASSTSSRS